MQLSRWVVGPVLVAAGALGCVDSVEVDAAETGAALAAGAGPVAEFDPAQSVVPLPNALLMSPVTGRVNVPPSCGETPGSAAAGLRAVLNQLDGFGTSQASLVATFSEPVDTDSLDGRVFLVRLAERGVPLTRFEAVALDLVPGSSTRFAADCQSSSQVPNLSLRPRAPLLGSSTYGVLLVDGILSESGKPMRASPSWGLVRQSEPPVRFSEAGNGAEDLLYNATPFDPSTPEGLASLQGLDLLWRGHAPLLAAFDLLGPALLGGQPLPREGMLLAWAFNTQTIGDPLDASIDGSPANQLTQSPAPLSISAPVAGAGGPLTVEQFFATALPGVPCSALGCDAIGAIYSASPLSAAPSFGATSYLQGDDCSLPAASAGAFDDPIAPSVVCQRSSRC